MINIIQLMMLLVSMLCNLVTLLFVAGLGHLSAPFGEHLFGRLCSFLLIGSILAFFAGQWYVFEVLCQPPAAWKQLYDGLLLLSTCCFLRTVLTNPGTPDSDEWRSWLADEGTALVAKLPAEEVREREHEQCVLGGRPWCSNDTFAPATAPWPSPGPTRCSQCKQCRPERAHHCRRCGVCVLRMDHHCALVGTCVGWRNHKYFLLLQLWQFLACFTFLYAPDGPGVCAFRGGHFSREFLKLFQVDMAAVWAAGMFVITGRTLIVTLCAACMNETSIEARYAGLNPYSFPDCESNLRQLLGYLCDPRLFLPLEPVGRDCNGAIFPAGLRGREAVKAADV